MNNKTALFSLAAKFLEPTELESYASEADPYKTWLHFVFTDDKPNANKQRIPKEEFASLVKSAKFMPIKKAEGGIGDYHDGAIPMGSIASAKIEEGEHVSKIEGLAALWNKEYPEDIAALKQAFNDGKPIDFSWEIGYQESKPNESDSEVEDLFGCTTKAATIVGFPAYEGRTGVLAMASVGESFEERIDKVRTALAKFMMHKDGQSVERYWPRQTFSNSVVVKDYEDVEHYEVKYSISTEGKVEFDFTNQKKVTQEWIEAHLSASTEADEDARRNRINKQATAKWRRIKSKKKEGGSSMELKDLMALFEGLEPEEQAKAALENLTDFLDEFNSLKTERDGLVEDKEKREEDERKASLLKGRLDALKEIGVEYSDEELASKAKMLIEMNDDAFDFFVTELSAGTKREDKPVEASLPIPRVTGSTDTKTSLELIKEYLKEEDKTTEGDN